MLSKIRILFKALLEKGIFIFNWEKRLALFIRCLKSLIRFICTHQKNFRISDVQGYLCGKLTVL